MCTGLTWAARGSVCPSVGRYCLELGHRRALNKPHWCHQCSADPGMAPSTQRSPAHRSSSVTQIRGKERRVSKGRGGEKGAGRWGGGSKNTLHWWDVPWGKKKKHSPTCTQEHTQAHICTHEHICACTSPYVHTQAHLSTHKHT